MNALLVNPTRPAAGVPQKNFPTYVRLIIKNPKWGAIQEDIILGRLTPQKIAEKYDLRQPNGGLAIRAVTRYGQLLRERHAELFEKLDEAEAKAVIGELQDNTRKVFALAEAAYGKALEGEPHFGAAKEFLEMMLSANEHLSSVAGVAKEEEASGSTTQVNNWNVLQLPKAQPMQRVG